MPGAAPASHPHGAPSAAVLLKQARKRRGISQRDLAARAGVAHTTIARIESGRHQPSLPMLQRLLNAAGYRANVELANIVRPSELLEQKRDEVLRLAAQHRIRRVRVFGSVARGDDRPDSDLDLLVDFESDATLFDQAAFVAAVEDLLGVSVDTVSSAGLRLPRDRLIMRDARDV